MIVSQPDERARCTSSSVTTTAWTPPASATWPSRSASRSTASPSLHRIVIDPARAIRSRSTRIGTPTDCVHIGITGLLGEEPDMVISGVNAGSNMGDDVIYSGTVAAAMEGRFLGSPAMAVSLAYAHEKEKPRPSNYATAARAARVLMTRLLEEPLPADTILNVNVPDLPWDEIKGFETTRLGHRHRSEDVIPLEDPRGRQFYWIGAPGGEEDNGPGTDFNAIRRGYVSVTPIHVDLTRYQALDPVGQWVQSIRLDEDAA